MRVGLQMQLKKCSRARQPGRLWRKLSIVVTSDPSVGVMDDFIQRLHEVARVNLLSVQLIISKHLDANMHVQSYPANEFVGIEVIQSPCGDQESAIWVGLHHARHPVVITMDPDMAANLVDIPRMLALHDRGIELIYTWRTHRADAPLWRLAASAAFNAVVRCIARVPLHDINTPMTLLSAKAKALLLAYFLPRDPYKVLMYRHFSEHFEELPIVVLQGRKRLSNYGFWSLFRLGYFRLAKVYRHRRNQVSVG